MTARGARIRRLLVGRLTWGRLARSAVCVYLGLWLGAHLVADRMIFHPPPSDYRVGGEITRIPVSPDGACIAVLACTNPAARYTILFAHGNAETLADDRFLLEAYRARGFAAYTFDYRGYGRSDGTPGARRALEDGEAAYRHLTQTLGVPPERIVLHGRSLGGAVALHLAAEHRVAGVIAESTFVTAFRVLTRVPLFPTDVLRNDRAMRRVRCPVLVIHGTADTTIPCWHGERLLALAPPSSTAYWAAGAGHNDVLDTNEAEYWRQVTRFTDGLAR